MTGHILIAVNPFRKLSIYEEAQACRASRAAQADPLRCPSTGRPPHTSPLPDP